VLDFRTGSDDNHLKVGGFLLGDVGTLEGSLTAFLDGEEVVLVEVLTREDEGGRSILAGYRGDEGTNGLFGITGTVDIDIGEDADSGNSLDGLMGGSILTNSNRVVG